VHQTPRTAERGAPAEEKRLRLELKLIADVGIVGVPNAGKSTLLAASTNARPKIAPYPFTTVEPNLGVVDLDEDTSLILADIPGLIEGASQGVGLGHDFLRHIQRTRVLIHLLDGMSEDPLLDYAQINSELALFDPLLKQKPQVIALNKLDLDDVKARWPELARKFKARRLEILGISAVTGENVRQLLFKAYELLQTAPQVEPLAEGGGELPVYRPEEDARAFTIEREPGGWRVRGKAIERAAEMTYWELDQSVRRFQALIQRTGIEAGLRKAGVQPGDTVFIGEYELEWAD
jgi:GTP-binding protein